MKDSGDQEERTQAHAVHPGGDLFPAVIWETVQQGHAHECWDNKELHTDTDTDTHLGQSCDKHCMLQKHDSVLFKKIFCSAIYTRMV